MKGFDSCTLIEKGFIGKSVLSSPSSENPSCKEYRHSPPSGKIPAAEGLTPSGKISSSEVAPSVENRISRVPRHSLPSEKNPSSGRIDPEWKKSQQLSSFEWGEIPSVDCLAWKGCNG